MLGFETLQQPRLFTVREGVLVGRDKPFVIAVDGPAGSGKSSVCAKAAQMLRWTYVNTGFLYRAVGVVARKRDIDMSSEAKLIAVARDLAEEMRWDPNTREVWFKGENLTPLLSTVEAGNDASDVAKMPLVREALLPLQRKLTFLAETGAIVDGRDIGTVVFPDADLKVYLTASLQNRAERRFNQLLAKTTPYPMPEINLEEIKKDIALRDAQDGERATAPLKQADDAVLLDTSNLGVQESVQALVDLIQQNVLSEKL